jgi:hypothetical protein
LTEKSNHEAFAQQKAAGLICLFSSIHDLLESSMEKHLKPLN